MYNSRKKKNRRTLNTTQAIKSMFGGRKRRPCAYCGKTLTVETATFDHVVALSCGGYDKRKNGVISCARCNHRKGSMSADEFRKQAKSNLKLSVIE